MEIYSLKTKSDKFIWAAIAAISCGEPQEIATELERIDMNDFLTDGQTGVYLIRAENDSMEHEIRCGDWMIVHRERPAVFGDAVVAYLNGDFLVKDFQPKQTGLFLVPKNQKYPPQIVTAKDDFETFGVVTGIVRKFKNF